MKITRTLGIDIGGTKILSGIVDESGQLSDVQRFSTIGGDGKGNFALLKAILDDPTYRDIPTVGISVPTTIAIDGSLRDDYGFTGFGGWNLGALLTSCNRRVYVYHDVECGALAEARIGAGKLYKLVLYITLGTGLSHCLVVNSIPYRGATGSGYYSGYMVPSRCGRTDCTESNVESIAAGPGIAKAYNGGRKAETVFAQAVAGDVKAVEVIDHASWHMGALTADLIHILNPEIIVFGGGLGTGESTYIQKISIDARKFIKPVECLDTPIVIAELGPFSCVIGAALQANMDIE